MVFKNVAISGGAGFVGSNLAVLLKQAWPGVTVMAVDNLRRRGSELSLGRFQSAGVGFIHADVRCREDLETLPDMDLFIDCAAEPAVQAATTGSPQYVLTTNLVGTINCLELARLRGAAFLFLSTGRVYPIGRLNALPYREDAWRFRWENSADIAGFSEHGIAEEFSLDGARSLYGASKLACELLVQEYVYSFGMRGLIDRCGTLAGPWQMGKVDQGVVSRWVACHYYHKPLEYLGFGGHGKQVRDVLHVEDLFDLLRLQIDAPERWDGRIYNVGGGNDNSLSLLELTALCQQLTGTRVEITPVPETSPLDVRLYATDARKARRDFGWRPTRGTARIVEDIYRWIGSRAEVLRTILA